MAFSTLFFAVLSNIIYLSPGQFGWELDLFPMVNLKQIVVNLFALQVPWRLSNPELPPIDNITGETRQFLRLDSGRISIFWVTSTFPTPFLSRLLKFLVCSVWKTSKSQLESTISSVIQLEIKIFTTETTWG